MIHDKRDMARGLWIARYGFESLNDRVYDLEGVDLKRY
jgi:hypothetical protein